MLHSRIVQLIALFVMIASLMGSGSLLPGLLSKASENTLRYNDLAAENLPPEIVIGNAIGALRGIIVDVLWIRATTMKEKGLYYEANALAEFITKLQPRFPSVWAFMGHNMAYNISVATNTEEERWQWVRKGINLVRLDGLKNNPNDVELHKELSFWFLHKIEGISDDAHLYYKRELCKEWHNLLGRPPKDWEERIAWIKKVADAPETLEDAVKRTPKVRELYDALEKQLAPYDQIFKFNLNRDLLNWYQTWNSLTSASWKAQAFKLEESWRKRAEAGNLAGELFVVLDELASNPDYQEAWDTLLSYVRKKVLKDEYNMDAQFMYELTRDLGPIDWRHGSAHALYWSRRGAIQAELRSMHEDKIYKIINNDRMSATAMQDLARFGNITFDPGSSDIPTRLPDPRWIEPIEDFFRYLYIKHQKVPGWGPDNFIAWHENFMKSSVRELYRMGWQTRAEEIYKRLDDLYGMGHIPPSPEFSVPMDIFVQKQVFEEYAMQPHVSTTDVQNALYYAIVFGKAMGDEEKYTKAKEFADKVLNYFRGNEYSNFVNKFGKRRVDGIIADLQNVELMTYLRVMTDESVSFQLRMSIWHGHMSQAMKLELYDLVVRTVYVHYQRYDWQEAIPFENVFPEPEGIVAFRQERERKALEEQQKREGEGERATTGNR